MTVLLTSDRLPPGTNVGQATVALRRAILSLPGAKHLHVQLRPFLSREEAWLSVSLPGSEGVIPRGRAWQQHHAMIERLVLETLAELAVPGPAAAGEAPAPLRATTAVSGDCIVVLPQTWCC